MPEPTADARMLLEAARRAVEHHTRGNLAEAERLYLAILAADAEYFDALHLLGVLRTQQGRYDDAIALITRALARNPGSTDAHLNLGNALSVRGRPAEAVESYRRALAFGQGTAVLYSNLGAALKLLNREEEAAESLRGALAIKPDHVPAHLMLGAVLEALGQEEDAIASYRRAVALSPGNATAHVGLGVALNAFGRHEEAVAAHRNALEIDPASSEALDGLGMALGRLNRHGEAITACRKAVAIQPDLATAHWNLGLSLLAQGDFADGWREYEWRWRVEGLPPPRELSRPLWLGVENPAGRTVLLHAEQGLGDTLQFVRYAPLVAARGARVVLACQPPLARLLGRVAGIAQVVALDEPWPAFDLHCPLMSLPLAFGTQLDTIPAAIPYLHADPGEAEQWRARMGEDARLNVGLVWAGSPREDDRSARRLARRRGMALAQFAPLAAARGVRFFSLQKGAAAVEASAPPEGMELVDHTARLEDFADTAALVSALDLVITVDTAVAHLAGGMGKPVWILSRFDADWRWLLDRDDSPWYPAARLYRQTRSGDWAAVMERAGRDLLAASRT